jgi:metal-sulfur cluster biosynthetic enzyme
MQPTSELITVERDCEAILIPSGDPIKLIKGTHVRITQALGGDYTLFVNGNLVKIAGVDADAIGKKAVKLEKYVHEHKFGKPVEEEQVWEQLRTVYDPEIPVNIVELGLVYDLNIKSDENGSFVNFHTLATTGESLGDMGKLSVLAGVHKYPARVKCATLAWHTFYGAIRNLNETIKTE